MDASTTNLHPDFGPSDDPSTPYGMPYSVVSPSQPETPITFQYGDESDPGPYPFSAATPIEGGQGSTGDRHAIMVNPATCTLYELDGAQYSASGSTAVSGAIWNLNSNALRPAGWTSADAAGLPILPGLVRYDEVQSGVITHAIRMTAEATNTSYLWPARHEAGTSSNPNLPPMGARFRLKASYDISGYSAQAQVVLRAMQQYGLIVADNGSNWYFGGTADDSWPIALVNELKQVPAAAFEAVDESSLMVDPNSGQARQLGSAVNCGSGPGYRMAAADGGVFSFCQPFLGSMGGRHLNAPMVGMAADPRWWRVLGGGLRRWHLQLRERRLLRIDRIHPPEQTDRGHGSDAGRRGVLARGLRRRHLQLWRRALLRLGRVDASGPADRRDGIDARWRRVLAGGRRWRHLQLRRRRLLRVTRRPAAQQAHRGHGLERIRSRLLARRVRRRHLRLRRCRLRWFSRVHCPRQADRRHVGHTRWRWATGWSPPTAASSATAMRSSTARRAASRSTRRSWPWADAAAR